MRLFGIRPALATASTSAFHAFRAFHAASSTAIATVTSAASLAATVASMVDKSQHSEDDMKSIQEAAKLMGSIGTKLPMGNEEASYLGNAIPSVLRKAHSKITQDASKSNPTNLPGTAPTPPDCNPMYWILD